MSFARLQSGVIAEDVQNRTLREFFSQLRLLEAFSVMMGLFAHPRKKVQSRYGSPKDWQ
jgi:hypothetical protein